MSERKLKAWEAAGLIDAAAAARIRAWEAEHGRPLAIWAVIGLGALTIGLGLISVVAANWDAVPGEARLGIHLAILGGVIGYSWARGGDLAVRQPWIAEALLFVAGMLGLTFMGHVGQVYQTSSPLWQPVAFWLLLFAPLLLGRGQSWLTAMMLMAGLLVMLSGHVSIYGEKLDESDRFAALAFYLAAVAGVPLLFGGLGAVMRARSARPDFWTRIEQLGLAYAVVAASVATITATFGSWESERLGATVWGASTLYAAACGAVAGLVWLVRPTVSGRSSAAIFLAAGVVTLLCYPVSGGALASALLFFALWGCSAAASLKAGWRGVFQAAVGLMALRLVVLSFELAGDLLTSGAGLIVAGLLILAIAWGAVRISKRFAPQAEGGR